MLIAGIFYWLGLQSDSYDFQQTTVKVISVSMFIGGSIALFVALWLMLCSAFYAKKSPPSTVTARPNTVVARSVTRMS